MNEESPRSKATSLTALLMYYVAVKAQGFAEAAAETAVLVSSGRGLTVKLRPPTVVQNVNVEA